MTYILMYTVNKSLCPLSRQTKLWVQKCAYQDSPELPHLQYSRWSSFVVWLTILHICKHTAWCCSGGPSHCLNVRACVYVCTLGGGVMAGRGVPGYEPEHLPRLMHCSPAPLQGQGSSSEPSHFPMGKHSEWRQTARSTLQTDTLVWAGLSLSLSTHWSLLLLISQMEATQLDPVLYEITI